MLHVWLQVDLGGGALSSAKLEWEVRQKVAASLGSLHDSSPGLHGATTWSAATLKQTQSHPTLLPSHTTTFLAASSLKPTRCVAVREGNRLRMKPLRPSLRAAPPGSRQRSVHLPGPAAAAAALRGGGFAPWGTTGW